MARARTGRDLKRVVEYLRVSLDAIGRQQRTTVCFPCNYSMRPSMPTARVGSHWTLDIDSIVEDEARVSRSRSAQR